ITVWTRVVPGDNQLIVQDFGSGILARFILWILTVFYTQSADGTGVGLGICDRGMHRIGGRVTVWSLWGVGTMIIFHFPPAPAEKIREHEEQLAQERRRQEEERAKERRELQEQLARARAQLEQIPPRLRDQARTQIRELERRVGAANVSS
ncbi:MAG: ATP-binding protein, partial [Myxococcota bacterium]